MSTNEVLQLVAWGLALTEFSLALYILALNFWHTANRHVAFLLIFNVVNNLALGQLVQAVDSQGAWWPTAVLAAFSAGLSAVMLLTALVLLTPQWLRGRGVVLRWSLWLAMLVPVIWTALDLFFGTRLWFTGMGSDYTGGFATMRAYVGGIFSAPWVTIFTILPVLLSLIPAIYVGVIERSAAGSKRTLARIVIIATIGGLVVSNIPATSFPRFLTILGTSAIFAFAYAFAGFFQMISERRLQRGRLQGRLAALILATVLPSTAGLVILTSYRAGSSLRQHALMALELQNAQLEEVTLHWLDGHETAILQSAALPDMISMDPERQRQIVATLKEIHPEWGLVATIRENGLSLVQSDNRPSTHYEDRAWFQAAVRGKRITYQAAVASSSYSLMVTIAAPIRNESGKLVGVLMVETSLQPLADLIKTRSYGMLGESGGVYVVDNQNRVLIHRYPELALKLTDYSAYPPVDALRHGRGAESEIFLIDTKPWRGRAVVLPNEWIVGVQEPETELFAAANALEHGAWLTVAIGTLLLIILAVLTIRQALRPIATLTQTVTAVSAGALGRLADVESEDELGILAQAINQMSTQLKELVSGLEQRVTDRTQVMENRALQLQRVAEVVRDVAGVADLDTLLKRALLLLRERFFLHEVGFYFADERGQYLVLRAASGVESQKRLSSGLRVPIDTTSMVGQAVILGQAQWVARETETQIAVPLRIGERIIGALDLLLAGRHAMYEPDLMIWQLLSDQLAGAIENSRLFNESQETLRQLQAVYGQYTKDSWQAAVTVQGRPQGYLYRRLGVEPLMNQPVEVQSSLAEGKVATLETGAQGSLLGVPIKLRDQVLGVLKVRFEEETVPEEAAGLIEDIAARLALSLENARLLEETRNQAARERMVTDITARVRAETEVEALLERALGELSLVLNAKRAAVQLEVRE